MLKIFTDAATVNPKGTKVLLVKDVSTFVINDKPAGINNLRKLSNPPV